MHGRAGTRGKGKCDFDPVLGDHHHLAILDVADIAGADDVEGASLGTENMGAVELAQDQRPDTERVAGADHLLVGQHHQRIGALELAQAIDETVDHARLLGAGDEMQDHLGVGGGLTDGAGGDELAPERQAVGQIAVVPNGKAAGSELGEERLDIAQNGLAGGRVADMTDGGAALQPGDDLGLGEAVADQAEAPLGMETPAVEGDDAGRLLAAMLERVQAERRQGCGIVMAEDAEDAAFLAQLVTVEIEVRYSRRDSHDQLPPS